MIGLKGKGTSNGNIKVRKLHLYASFCSFVPMITFVRTHIVCSFYVCFVYLVCVALRIFWKIKFGMFFMNVTSCITTNTGELWHCLSGSGIVPLVWAFLFWWRHCDVGTAPPVAALSWWH